MNANGCLNILNKDTEKVAQETETDVIEKINLNFVGKNCIDDFIFGSEFWIKILRNLRIHFQLSVYNLVAHNHADLDFFLEFKLLKTMPRLTRREKAKALAFNH